VVSLEETPETPTFIFRSGTEFLKNGGEAMLNSLVDLFMIVSDLEIIPSEWKNGIIKPLHKSGSAMDLDNFSHNK
jgi:hypothetical protein